MELRYINQARQTHFNKASNAYMVSLQVCQLKNGTYEIDRYW